MQASPALIVIYSVLMLILLVAIVFFILTLRTVLRKTRSKLQLVEKPVSEGLSASGLHSSIQSQILELQATEIDLPEHETRFRNLLEFLKSARNELQGETGMLELYILRLESLPHSDPSHLPTLAALFSWSQTKAKEMLGSMA